MAKSASHKFGQIIGDLLEVTMLKYLGPIARKHSLYLDYKHRRDARGGKKEVVWKDINGNKHKLDIVFEKNGSEQVLGQPLAFIEMAWRRYTKHSKNKAQEMQGAILPLIARYNKYAPFYGAVLAGEFTAPSIAQMESEGFKIVYFEYSTIIKAFSLVGINVYWGEGTTEGELSEKVAQYENLSNSDIEKVIDSLIEQNKMELERFIQKLDESLLREIDSVSVFSLHGMSKLLNSVKEAYDYIISYDEKATKAPLVKYEIIIRYNNGDRIEAQFKEKYKALAFLTEYMG
ncbi:Uncharacterised protein [Streptococcus pneumoniae]|uniref:hypothetical protein n=1 Tax=Bacillus paranthracis TaxID=2026186 RepID=UPI0005E0A4AF|nr:hypothetical protein [Bacillus paranthracis]CKE81825.1 Uncharacterised protein [Bacillus paranthracis]CKF00724.1 Uncharacterised protein [Streptococcus pneumoniae]